MFTHVLVGSVICICRRQFFRLQLNTVELTNHSLSAHSTELFIHFALSHFIQINASILSLGRALKCFYVLSINQNAQVSVVKTYRRSLFSEI